MGDHQDAHRFLSQATFGPNKQALQWFQQHEAGDHDQDGLSNTIKDRMYAWITEQAGKGLGAPDASSKQGWRSHRS